MGFFDLNIPYETSLPSKATRMKLVIKAMELGYSGVAYNRTMRGVMSDHDRCSIPLLSFSSLLSLVPSLASSVSFHRELLGVSQNTPFRQYTRLTVCVDSPAQAQVLNSGNPILKSYDVVAVKPTNQVAFDHACEKSEVDIIAIDFSEKLPFRLKMSMVKAAVERGVYFEIIYSDLIAERRQMIPNAKLLVDWTRGKNLIFSSAASSVNEIRGPYDVANLLSMLLGLSMERAKAAISKNCRNLLTNSLRKRYFYKEAIRVEPLSSGQTFDSNNPFSMDWLMWDPISSGEGDLQLDDVPVAVKASKTMKAIDFDSIIDSTSSHGGGFLMGSKFLELTPASVEVPEKLDGDHPLTCHISEAPSQHQISGSENSQEARLPDAEAAAIHSDEIWRATSTDGKEAAILDGLENSVSLAKTEGHDSSLQHISSSLSNSQNDDSVYRKSVMPIEVSGNTDFLSQIDKCMKPQGFDAEVDTTSVVDQDVEVILEPQKDAQACTNHSGTELMEYENNSVSVEHKLSLPLSSSVIPRDASPTANYSSTEDVQMKELDQREVNRDIILLSDEDVKDDSQVASFLTFEEQSSQEQNHGKAQGNNLTSVPSSSGRTKAKLKKTTVLLPFKRLLHPIAFKKKGKRSEHRRMLA
ncbi:unnamed protein product [Linum tenue]|uniref:Uncharacterized protein n=1 Tax=Linum tenue TaxID=586396 RepID=A0AAV0QI26_9ROSI|nr:unnamed protein product [Linum tenue]